MAWVPLDSLEPFRDRQIYTRLDSTHYRYQAADGSFEQVLTVDGDGFVVEHGAEVVRNVVEGRFHGGESSVVQVVARRR